MAIQFDTHIHTSFSTDSETSPVEQLRQAAKSGLKGICFTDHMDYEFPASALEHPVDGIPFCFDWEIYKKEIREIAETSSLTVYTGVECGLQKTNTVVEKNAALSQDSSLDYLIGSLHLVDGQDPYYPSFWQKKDASQCIQSYFELMYENLHCFHEMDSLGHLDYIVRYAPSDFSYTPSKFREIIEAILEYVIKKDIALEINTSEFKNGGKYPNPHIDIVSWYYQKGGRLITVGSDAHTPEYLAYHFEETASMLKKVGLRQYVVYHKRKPFFHDL